MCLVLFKSSYEKHEYWTQVVPFHGAVYEILVAGSHFPLFLFFQSTQTLMPFGMEKNGPKMFGVTENPAEDDFKQEQSHVLRTSFIFSLCVPLKRFIYRAICMQTCMVPSPAKQLAIPLLLQACLIQFRMFWVRW